MRLVGFIKDGVRHVGALAEEKVTDLGTAQDFYRDPDAALTGRSERTGALHQLDDLKQVPFVPETARIFCVGINYLSHADEAAQSGIGLPKFPMIFGRWEQSLVVGGTPVPVPPNEEGLDWEVELAVVIKDETWAATEDDALQHVLGYTAFNDISARRKQTETMQFTLGKNADRSGPIGPVLVTTDELPDPGKLRLTTKVNGKVMQDSDTSHMIHSVAKIIAYITDTVTLLPGDVIATGTPSGVGAALDPPVFLHPGDNVEVSVEGIGSIVTPIVTRDQL